MPVLLVKPSYYALGHMVVCAHAGCAYIQDAIFRYAQDVCRTVKKKSMMCTGYAHLLSLHIYVQHTSAHICTGAIYIQNAKIWENVARGMQESFL